MTDLYRYFSIREGPFEGHRILIDEREYQETYGNKSFMHDYPTIREATDRRVRDLFISKGGVPETEHPYHMVLGRCDEWFKGRKGFIASLAIDIEEFDPGIISFTYGDSIPSMNGLIDRPYGGKVYTLSEIVDVIKEFGMPQDWNPHEEYGLENYIEAQIWSEKPLERYKRSFSKVNPVRHIESLVDGVIRATPNIIDQVDTKQLSFRDSLKMIAESKYRNVLINKLKNLNGDLYENNRIHGMIHAFRCSLYCILACIMRDCSIDEMLLSVDAVSQHDIGRKVDPNDHGRCGADIFCSIHPFYPDDELRMVMAAIHSHCLPDEEMDRIMSGYDIPATDCARCRDLSILVKDCDALDYIRLGIDGYMPKYIHMEDCRSLVRFAMCMNALTEWYPELLTKLLNGELS